MKHSRSITPLATAMLLLLALPAYAAQPTNDDFPGATLTGLTVTTTGSNVGATYQAGEPDPAGISGPTSVWWSWELPVTGSVTIDTAGSSFDTTLGVYTGSTVAALSLVAENDDSGYYVHSYVTFAGTAGTLYRIQVNGFLGETGGITLSIVATGAGAPSVIWLTPPGPSYASGSLMTLRWDVFGGTTSHTSVHYDTVNPPWAGPSTPTMSGAPGAYEYSLVAPSVAGSVLYYFAPHAVVDGTDILGPVTAVLISFYPPPPNDDFPGETFSGLPAAGFGSTFGATAQVGEPDPTGWSGSASVWWNWTAPVSEYVTIDTFGSTFDTTLGVYTGSDVTFLAAVAENDDAIWYTLQSQVTFFAIEGTTYLIQVNGFLGDQGDVMLSLAQAPPPPPPPPPAEDDDDDNCGSSGVDLLLPLALLWMYRRFRRA